MTSEATSRSRLGPAAAGAAVGAAAVGVIVVSGVEPWWSGLAAMVDTVVRGGAAALAWMVGAWGLGGVMAFLWGGSVKGSAGDALRLAAGVALMLWVSHAMGVAGLLRAGVVGSACAWLPVAAGVGMVGWEAWRRGAGHGSAFGTIRGGAVSWVWVGAGPAAAAVVVAACVPPGLLWRSEAHGFDVLSYHLQLPREWLAGGRLRPLEHNAYSWLPSYVEAAYLHLGAMMSWKGGDPFVDGEGWATFAAGLLHAMMAIAAAWVIAVVVGRIVRSRFGGEDGAGRFAGAVAGVLFLGTPWVVVAGSLAYDEMAVCLALAGGLLALEVDGMPAGRRGALVGLLAGAACAAKPTAMYMAALPLGILLLARTDRREWARAVWWGSVAGIAFLAPWWARNAAACGNPVFPYLASVFGEGHWTSLELERWRLGHHAAGGVWDRLRLLMSERGFGHGQWGATAAAGAACAAAGLAWRRTRRAVRPIAMVGVVQTAAWLAVGHLQSRFLLPAVVPMVVLVAVVGCGLVREGRGWRWAGIGIVVGVLAMIPAVLLVRGSAWPLGALVSAGVPVMTGEAFRGRVGAAEAGTLGPSAWVNLKLDPARVRLYLLGDSTPYYFRVPVLYHTTWDPSPLGVLLRETGGDVGESVARLRASAPVGRGATHVLVNMDEVRRLSGIGWYDPAVGPDVAEAIAREVGRAIGRWEGRVLIDLAGE